MLLNKKEIAQRAEIPTSPYIIRAMKYKLPLKILATKSNWKSPIKPQFKPPMIKITSISLFTVSLLSLVYFNQIDLLYTLNMI